jgi:putative endonuclease
MTKRDVGTLGESKAEAYLRRRGLRILERNFRLRMGEIDLVAQDGDTLVFVEVRSRANTRFGGAIRAVGPTKRRQVSRVAAAYLVWRSPSQARVRFDVVAITGDDVEWIRDAWRL